MEAECCGEKRESRFCPDCGTLLGHEDPLCQLLAHLSTQASSKRRTADRAFRRKKAEKDDYDARHAEYFDKSAKKWESWRDAVKEVLKKETREDN